MAHVVLPIVNIKNEFSFMTSFFNFCAPRGISNVYKVIDFEVFLVNAARNSLLVQYCHQSFSKEWYK